MSVHPRQVTPALLHVESILARLSGGPALQEVSRFLRLEFPAYRWVGVYVREGEELVLHGWDGDEPTQHARIPVALGLCGRAVRENRTVNVGDVQAAPEYIACFPTTRSEIVVPIRHGGDAVGELDVDGVTVSAFDVSDERFLEMVASRLAPAVQVLIGSAPSPPL